LHRTNGIAVATSTQSADNDYDPAHLTPFFLSTTFSLLVQITSQPSLSTATLLHNHRMVDVSDGSIANAVADISDPKGSTNWILLGYKDNSHIHVVGQGSGGANEAVGHLRDDQVLYGLVKVSFTADDETQRTKMAFYAWVGPSVAVLKRAKTGVHKSSIKSVIKDFAVELQTDSKDELSEESLVRQIKRVNY